MRSVWDILGLDGKPDDIKDVKKAYAKKLRETRPEDDRAGFMELRQAFEQAKQLMSQNGFNYGFGYSLNTSYPAAPPISSKPEPHQPDSASDDTEDPVPIKTDPDGPGYEDEYIQPDIISTDFIYTDYPHDQTSEKSEAELSSPDELGDILDRLSELLSHEEERTFLEPWDELISRSNDLSLSDFDLFEHQLVERLLDIFGYYKDPDAPFSAELYAIPIRFLSNRMGWDKGYFGDSQLSRGILWLREYGQRKPDRLDRALEPDTNQTNWFWVGLFIIFMVVRLIAYNSDSGYDYTPYSEIPNYRDIQENMKSVDEILRNQRSQNLLEDYNELRAKQGLPPIEKISLFSRPPKFEFVTIDGKIEMREIEPAIPSLSQIEQELEEALQNKENESEFDPEALDQIIETLGDLEDLNPYTDEEQNRNPDTP